MPQDRQKSEQPAPPASISSGQQDLSPASGAGAKDAGAAGEEGTPAKRRKRAPRGKTKPEDIALGRLSPHLVIDGAAKAIDFYREAFGAEELMRLPGPDGRLMHAAVRILGATVMLADEAKEWKNYSPKTLGGTPVTLYLVVENVDEVVAQAEAAGAIIVMPPADMFWGDRYGVIEDPFGHRWSIATPVRQMTPEEVRAAAEETFRSSNPADDKCSG